MINEIRKLNLELKTQRQEKRSPAFNLLASRITSNPDMGVGGTPMDIKDLCGKLKSNEKDSFVSLMRERRETLTALKGNMEISKNLRDSYERTLEVISAMHDYLGVAEKDDSTQ